LPAREYLSQVWQVGVNDEKSEAQKFDFIFNYREFSNMDSLAVFPSAFQGLAATVLPKLLPACIFRWVRIQMDRIQIA
jgi:hypothetical protein